MESSVPELARTMESADEADSQAEWWHCWRYWIFTWTGPGVTEVFLSKVALF